MGQSNIKMIMPANHDSASTLELLSGYPVYDKIKDCDIYKFDLSGFKLSECEHILDLTLLDNNINKTKDLTFLEISVCKKSQEYLGKVNSEFKRVIKLEPGVDVNLIKKHLSTKEIWTLEIPKSNSLDGFGIKPDSSQISQKRFPRFQARFQARFIKPDISENYPEPGYKGTFSMTLENPKNPKKPTFPSPWSTPKYQGINFRKNTTKSPKPKFPKSPKGVPKCLF